MIYLSFGLNMADHKFVFCFWRCPAVYVSVCLCRREAMLRQLEMELKQERSLTETMVADMVCVSL